MSWLSGSGRSAIGLDVGARQVKAVQLRRSKHRWRIQAAAAFPRIEQQTAITAEETSHICSVLGRQGFLGRSVVLAVPEDKLLRGILELPPRGSPAPLEQIARMELSRMHKASPESFEMAFWELPASKHVRDYTQVMAMACKHDDANEFLDVFESSGLDVIALDTRTCALARACQSMLAAETEITAVLDIGWSSSVLSIFFAGVVVYERLLWEVGIEALSHHVSAKLRLDSETACELLAEVELAHEGRTGSADDELQVPADVGKAASRYLDSIVRELKEPFSYATRQYSKTQVKRLLLTGGGACIRGAAGYLASELGMDVAVVTPADLADCPQQLFARCGNAAMTVAFGLALFEEEQAS